MIRTAIVAGLIAAAMLAGAYASTAQAATHPVGDMVKQTSTCMTRAGADVIRWPNGGKARWGKRWVSWQAFVYDGGRVTGLMTSVHNLSHTQEHRANLCLRPFGGTA